MYWFHEFKIGKYTFILKVQSFGEFNIRTGGMDARVPETALFIIPLDYDNIVGVFSEDPEQRLKEELQYLQEGFQIGNFYVFWTNECGRHAVCLDALRFKDVRAIVDFSTCDLMFKRAPRINEYRTWVLRYAEKDKRESPRYLYTVESPYEGENLQSLTHAGYLRQFFGVKVHDLKNPVGPDYVHYQEYNTSEKHVKKKGNGGD